MTLSASPDGVSGNGDVTSSPGTIFCGTGGTTCTDTFVEGSSVILTASPDINNGFVGWSGPCAGSGATCTLTLNADTIVDAEFQPAFSISGSISGVSAITPVTLRNDVLGVDIETVDAIGGSFFFQAQPPGDYTVTPAASAKTAPTSRSVTLTNADVNDIFFTATHTISGTVTYSGSKTGRIYVALHDPGNPQRNGFGTSVDFAGPGDIPTFEIRGVPGGRTYDVEVRLDHLDTALRNVANPVDKFSSGILSASVALPLITLTDPVAVLPQTPIDPEVIPAEGGALFCWGVPRDANFVEIADSYKIYYKAGPVVTTAIGGFDEAVTVSTFSDECVALLNLINGTQYTVVVTAWVGTDESSATAPISFIPAVPGGGVSVSGTIIFPATPPGSGDSTLYLLLGDEAPLIGHVPVVEGVTSAAYTINGVLPGTHELFAVIDVGNNQVLFDPGDLNSGDLGGEHFVTVETSPVTGQNLTMTGANAFVGVTTRHGKSHDGGFEGYGLIFKGEQGSKIPVKMRITGSNIPDTDAIPEGDFVGELFFWLPHDLPRPTVGEIYTFETSYLGDAPGTPPEFLTADVTAVLDSFPVPTAPIGIGTGVTIPTFTWNAPLTPPTPPFRYNVWIGEEVFGGGVNQVWSANDPIPDSQTSIVFNADGNANTSSLTIGTTYQWSIQIEDSKGNTASVDGIRFTP